MLLDEGAPDAETEDTSVLAKGSQSKALVAPEVSVGCAGHQCRQHPELGAQGHAGREV